MAPCVHVAISALNDALFFVSKGICSMLIYFFYAWRKSRWSDKLVLSKKGAINKNGKTEENKRDLRNARMMCMRVCV
jgi:hypothetical protein